MFCSNCGKQIADEAKFCDGCGAQQGVKVEVPNNRNDVYSSTESQQNKPKSNTKKIPTMTVKIIVIVVVLVAGSLIGKFVIAPSYTKEQTGGNGNNQGGQTITSQNDVPNPAYDAIFDGTYIVRMPAMFNMDTMSFAQKEADGVIYCGDYGYKDDLVKKIVAATYIPIHNLTEADKSLLENTARSELAMYEALDFCMVSYNMSGNYFSYTIEFDNLDMPQNYSKLYSIGYLEKNAPISMSETENRMIAKGAVKK